jgi:hypothetical protein
MALHGFNAWLIFDKGEHRRCARPDGGLPGRNGHPGQTFSFAPSTIFADISAAAPIGPWPNRPYTNP